MNKEITPKEEVSTKIRLFFSAQKHHLVSIHGVDIGGKVEIQWLFSDRVNGELTLFASIFEYEDFVPSFRDILPSSWIHEAEIKDMFGLDVEGAEFGLFLEKDGVKAPLRRSDG